MMRRLAGHAVWVVFAVWLAAAEGSCLVAPVALTDILKSVLTSGFSFGASPFLLCICCTACSMACAISAKVITE